MTLPKFPSGKAETEKKTQRAGTHQANGDDLIVSQGGLPGDHAGAPQVLHAQAVLLPDDVSDDVPARTKHQSEAEI